MQSIIQFACQRDSTSDQLKRTHFSQQQSQVSTISKMKLQFQWSELLLLALTSTYLCIFLAQVNCHQLSRFKRADKSSTQKPKSSDKSFEAECLRQHNKWRKLHRATPLKIDPKLVKFAQERADFIAASDGSQFKHPDDLDFGENLAWHSDSSSSCSKLIRMWYDEVKLYSYKEAAFSHEAGHFTQLVWRDTKRVGCARAFSSGSRGGVYLVCNYDPAGNWKGEFKENVKQAKKNTKKAKAKNKNKLDNSTTTTSTTSTSTTRKPTN